MASSVTLKRKRDDVADESVKTLADLESEVDSQDDSGSDQDDDEDQDEDNDDIEASEGDDEGIDVEMKSGKSLKSHRVSAEEIQMVRETAEYFHSNIFKLQIDQVLENVKIAEKHQNKLEKVLHKLHDLVQQVEDSNAFGLNEAEKSVKNAAIPFPNPKPARDVKYSFRYMKPEAINVVGGFSLKSNIREVEGNKIDLMLIMPRELLQGKDYLNYRYFHKRAFYIAYLVERLQKLVKKEKLPFVFGYKYFNDDPLRPIIRVSSESGKGDFHFGSTKALIYISVGLAENVFEPRKLAWDKNAIRVQLPEDSDSSLLPPTSLYNSSILSDMTALKYLKFVHSVARECEAFRDACKLGRLWLYQRGFCSAPSKGGFGHFEWSMMMAILIRAKVLLNGYNSFQLFKGTLLFLATKDLVNGQLDFDMDKAKYKETDDEKSAYGVPIALDTDHRLNILFNMSSWSYELLKHEASVTCDLLGDVVRDRFDSIFLKNISNPEVRFDAYFK